MSALDTTYTAEETAVAAHHHSWHAWAGDRVWTCTTPGCGAWISKLVDQEGRVISLPKVSDR